MWRCQLVPKGPKKKPREKLVSFYAPVRSEKNFDSRLRFDFNFLLMLAFNAELWNIKNNGYLYFVLVYTK